MPRRQPIDGCVTDRMNSIATVGLVMVFAVGAAVGFALVNAAVNWLEDQDIRP